MPSPKFLAVLLGFSLLFTSACALGDLLQVTVDAAQTALSETQTAQIAPPQATQAAQLPQSTLTPTPAPTAAPDGVHLDAGLENLKSYRASLTMKFSGKDNTGKTVESSLQVVEEINREANAHHLLSHSDLQGTRPGSVDIYQLGDAVYMLSSEADKSQTGCTLLSQDSLAGRTQLTLRPTDLFDNIWRAKLTAQDQQIGDFIADLYELGGAEMRIGSPEKISGQLWFSKDFGYVLRFTGSAQGILSLGFGTTYGLVDWEYNLSDINLVNISLPPDCLALSQNDLPVPEGAADLTQAGTRLSFHANPQPAAVISFYRAELAKQGWELQKGSSDGKTFLLDAIKDKRALQISVSAQDSGSFVVLISK